MAELTADLFISLDGFAAGDFGPYFGYGGPELDAWIAAEAAEPQVVVLGRVTYETLAAISADATDPVSRRLTELPKLVVSSTLQAPLAWANTRLLPGDATDVLPAVKRESDTPLRTMGSVSLVRSLVAAGLVDRLRLMVFPLTAGGAGDAHVFGAGEPERFALAGTTVLDGRVVLLEYRRAAD